LGRNVITSQRAVVLFVLTGVRAIQPQNHQVTVVHFTLSNGSNALIIAVQVSGPVASEQPFMAAQAVVRHLEYSVPYAYK